MPEIETNDQLRFDLRHIFYFTALVASGLVVAGPFSLLVPVVVLTAWWIKGQGNATWHEWLAYWFFVAILVVMLLPSGSTNSSAPRWARCMNNMRQCMLAMLNYKSAHQHFLPAWTEDDQGKPMHSWRVLILPFIEEQNLYDQYRLDEPWDSPHNARLANRMPPVYQCPSAPDSTTQTTYKLISDHEAFFDGNTKRSLKDAFDGPESTVVLIEDSENPVNWMEPDGISIEEAVAVLLNADGCHCGRKDTLFTTEFFGQHLVTLEAASYRVAPNADPESLRRAMKYADGHAPDPIEFAGSTIVHKPQGYLALATFVFLLALPGWYLAKRKS